MWVDVSESEEGEEGADGDKGKESATEKKGNGKEDNKNGAKGAKSEQPKEEKSADRLSAERGADKVDTKAPATDKATIKRPSRIKGDSLRLAPRRQRGDKEFQQVDLKGGEGFELKESDFGGADQRGVSQRKSRE